MQACHDSTNVKGRKTRGDKTHQFDKDAPDNIYFKLWRFSLVGKVVENRILLHELWPRERKRLSVSVFFGRDTGCCCCLWLRVEGRGFRFRCESKSKPAPILSVSHLRQQCYRLKKPFCWLLLFTYFKFILLAVIQIKIYDVCYFLSCLMLHY